jgi:hypothetical protein
MRIVAGEFIGHPVQDFLGAEPIKSWKYSKEVAAELVPPAVFYEFPGRYISIRCTSFDIVDVIFIQSESGLSVEVSGVLLNFSMPRAAIVASLGSPRISRPPFVDDILGSYGARDVFYLPNCEVHIEYELGSGDQVRQISISSAKHDAQ